MSFDPVGICTVIIGAGHAGLAMSRCLAERNIEHIVLERGQVANAWRTERWPALRLLTPNWQSRLPGYAYTGDDPNGFMSVTEVITFIDNYAKHIDAPVLTKTTVTSVERNESGYQVRSDKGAWQCQCLVVATGPGSAPRIPRFASLLPRSIRSLSAITYEDPESLPKGGVLITGAGATGIQLAYDIQRSGRPVILAVGEHVRLPREYRGRDIQWWLDAAGILDENFEEVDDIRRARHVPSPQLIGSEPRRTLDLNVLTAMGVTLVGSFSGIRDGLAQFSGSLPNKCQLADLKMKRTLKRLDAWALESGKHDSVGAHEDFEPTGVPKSPRLSLDLKGDEIRTVLWATGFQPEYPWLQVPVLDNRGQIKHRGGVVDSPGMYLIGMNFLRRRKSSFIHGAGDDAYDLSEHLNQYLKAT